MGKCDGFLPPSNKEQPCPELHQRLSGKTGMLGDVAAPKTLSPHQGCPVLRGAGGFLPSEIYPSICRAEEKQPERQGFY